MEYEEIKAKLQDYWDFLQAEWDKWNDLRLWIKDIKETKAEIEEFKSIVKDFLKEIEQ